MKKILLLALLVALTGQMVLAQSAKTTPPVKGPQPAPERLKIKPWPGKASVPPAANPFGLSGTRYQPAGPLVLPAEPGKSVRIQHSENGLPIFFNGLTNASGNAESEKTASQRALDYLSSLRPTGLSAPSEEFVARSAREDEQGNLHVRLEQVYQGIPVYGGELIAHTKNGAFDRLNGRYYPTPKLATTTPAIDRDQALQKVVEHLGNGSLKSDWTPEERLLIGGEPLRAELVVYHPGRQLDAERLAWHLVLYPNVLHRVVYFIDALNGEVLHHFDHTCDITGHDNHTAPPSGGPVTASGLDLNNQNRTFGAWMEGSSIIMEDAGQPMFNAGASQMPGSPVGAIVTLDAKNTSPENPNSFDYQLVVSGSTVFNNKNAVSTHWNAIKSYEYYQSTHARNSIDGVGGNVISLFNVAESNGASLENAFWNGAAMWYGNGGATFTQLAGGLDVGGHEMTHGVIESSANLEYQYESGALNESFADVFAVCIDRGDWKIGEDVVRAGATPHDCLRDMQTPNNGFPAQPQHVNEQYIGPQDNGGVHINSGIPNRAFYLFASNAAVGLDKAEKVYYKALQDYLVKSSQFIDCRLAVIQAANDLYGSAVANAAADAFTTVGIIGNQGGNYQGELAVNPGADFILCTSNDGQNLDLAQGNGQLLGTIYDQGVASRPSISDNGMQAVFVNTEGHIIGVDLSYNGNNIDYQWGEISFFPEWRNAAISKDGRFLAGLTTIENNRIEIFDLADPLLTSRVFFLYNPTYTTGQTTNNVLFADVMEFDYSGEYLMYDAYNELISSQGEDLSYWDVNILKFWENNQFTGNPDAPVIKLFNSLPDNYNVANATFAKNAPFVIALDLFNVAEDIYDVLGVNLETGDWDYLVFDNTELGWPNYTRLDDAVIYQKTFGNGRNIFRRGIEDNRITGKNNATSLLIQNRDWGTWFANGDRSLLVDTDEPDARRLQLSAAPNPATDRVRLNFEAPEAGNAQVLVSDLLGRPVLAQEMSLPQGPNQVEINLHNLPAGAYTVRVQTRGGGAAVKVVKQ